MRLGYCYSGAHFCFGCFILCSLNRRKHSFSDFCFVHSSNETAVHNYCGIDLCILDLHCIDSLSSDLSISEIEFLSQKTQDPSLIAIRSLTTLTH